MGRNRKSTKHLFEALESRRLLSIAGAALSPPLATGAKWTVSHSATESESITVVGPASFMGHTSTKIQDVTHDSSDDSTTTSLIYVGKDAANDIVFWGIHDTTTNASGTSVSDLTFASGLVQIPASMNAGTSQTFNTDAQGTSSFTDAKTGKTTTNSNTATEKTVITLVSSSTQTVTVPAGTFKCYQLKAVHTITADGKSSTTTDNDYLTTGGLPPIKTVNGGVVDTTTNVLTSFSGPRKPAAKLGIDTPPSDVKINTAMVPAVQIDVDDADGGIVFDNTSTVTLTAISVPAGGVMSGVSSVKAVQGTATFSGLKFSKPGKYTIKATDGSLTSVTTQVFNVTSVGATKLVFGEQPTDIAVSKSITPAITVKVEDADGNVVTTDDSIILLDLTGTIPVGASLGGTVDVKAVNGIATFDKVDVNMPGTYKLLAADGSLESATSDSFKVSSALKATKLGFTVQPATTVAGKTIAPSVKVTVETAGGETVVTDHSIVTLTLGSGTGPLAGTLTATAVNGIATFSNLSLTKTGLHTLKASDGTLTAATSNSFNITPATASKLVFAGTPATELAGKPISPAVVIDIEDTFGNIVTTSSASVAMSIATGGSTLTGTTSVSAKSGVATFSNLILTKLGKYTVKAAASAVASATSGAFSVIPGVASKLVLVKSPTSATAGKAISPALVVDIEDAFGNIVTTNTSTVKFTATGGSALTGTSSVAAKAGVATFSNLLLDKAAKYTLKATDGTLASATSASFTVNAATASKLVLVKSPTSATAGKAISPSLIVDIEDAFGNIVTTNTSAVKFTATGGSALTGTSSVAAKAGVATFSNLLLDKAAKYTLKATDGTLTSATSASFTVSPAAASKLILVKSPGSTTAGKAISPALVVDIEDAFGNIVTTNTSTVKFTATGGSALTGTSSVAAKAGVATFSNLILDKAAKYTLKATDGTLASATTASFTVNAAAASKLVITKAPTSGKKNTSLTGLSVAIEDAFGNVAITNTTKVTFAISSGPTGATITGNAISAIAGITNFTGLKLNAAGTYKLKATDGSLASATTGSIVIT